MNLRSYFSHSELCTLFNIRKTFYETKYVNLLDIVDFNY